MFLYAWLVLLFLLGACVGSFLNVCIARLPWEKNILWPASRCGHCFQAIRWYDNLPLVSYLLLRGKCRTCGTRFSARYLFIEVFTGFCFAGLFYLIAVVNVHDFRQLQNLAWMLGNGWPPPAVVWIVFFHHALLLSFLLIAFFCDLDHREIPLAITIPGTCVGLAFAVFCPWPWPHTPAQAAMPVGPWWLANPADGPRQGLYPWPVWGPPPDWLPPGSWQLGLATGIVGVVVAALLLRAIRFLFSAGLGIEAMGLGDADLMMMAGAFLGWQPAVVAFFVSSFPGLVFGVGFLAVQAHLTRRKIQLALELGAEARQPSLALQGKRLADAELAPALSAFSEEQRGKGLVIDFTALDELVDRCLTAIRDAGLRAGIRTTRLQEERVQPDLVMLAVRWALSRFRGPSGKSVVVHVLHDGERVAFKVDETQVAAGHLAAHLGKVVKQPRRTVLLVSLKELDRWSQTLLDKVKEAARLAGISKVQIGERGFPLGPALAVGTILTLLGWRWIGAHAQPLLFNEWLLLLLGGAGGLLMFGLSYGLRLMQRWTRGTPPEIQEESPLTEKRSGPIN